MIWCFNGRVKRVDIFISNECGLTNRAFQHFRLSDLSVRSTQTLFSLCSSFIYLLSAVCYMLELHVQFYRNKFQCFLFFIITVYESLKQCFAEAAFLRHCPIKF